MPAQEEAHSLNFILNLFVRDRMDLIMREQSLIPAD